MKGLESRIKEVFRLSPNTSDLHRPATPVGVFTRFSRCYLLEKYQESRRLGDGLS